MALITRKRTWLLVSGLALLAGCVLAAGFFFWREHAAHGQSARRPKSIPVAYSQGVLYFQYPGQNRIESYNVKNKAYQPLNAGRADSLYACGPMLYYTSGEALYSYGRDTGKTSRLCACSLSGYQGAATVFAADSQSVYLYCNFIPDRKTSPGAVQGRLYRYVLDTGNLELLFTRKNFEIVQALRTEDSFFLTSTDGSLLRLDFQGAVLEEVSGMNIRSVAVSADSVLFTSYTGEKRFLQGHAAGSLLAESNLPKPASRGDTFYYASSRIVRMENSEYSNGSPVLYCQSRITGEREECRSSFTESDFWIFEDVMVFYRPNDGLSFCFLEDERRTVQWVKESGDHA